MYQEFFNFRTLYSREKMLTFSKVQLNMIYLLIVTIKYNLISKFPFDTPGTLCECVII